MIPPIFEGILQGMPPIDEDTFWHPAFLPVLQLELEAYLEDLFFEAEHHLTTKPLQIDLLIIKKKPMTAIDNPIARIFRQYNVFEYKSPTISLSIDEFYKAIVYVLLYKAIDGLDITDMTLSIVLTKHPDVVFEHIRDVWKCKITEQEKGIYGITGFLFPIQIIENKKLLKENHVFLKNLNEGLDEETIAWAIHLEKEHHKIDISAYVDVITRANEERLKEMLMNSPTLERIIEEVGLAARWEKRAEERAKERKSIEIAQSLIEMGLDREKIAIATKLDLSTIESLYGTGRA